MLWDYLEEVGSFVKSVQLNVSRFRENVHYLLDGNCMRI